MKKLFDGRIYFVVSYRFLSCENSKEFSTPNSEAYKILLFSKKWINRDDIVNRVSTTLRCGRMRRTLIAGHSLSATNIGVFRRAVVCHGAQHAIHVCQQRLGSTCPAAGRCAVGIRPTVVLALKTCRLLESARGANGDHRRHTLHLVFGCPQLKQTSFARERTLDSATDLFQAAKKSVAWENGFSATKCF